MFYPVYSGFMTPADIKNVALAPQFDKPPHAHPTANHQIAADTMKPPMERWQRPLDEDRVKAIAAHFNAVDPTSGLRELMPNPVLLSENTTLHAGIKVTRTKLPDQSTGNTYDVTIDATSGKPLWILDGQHRIFGLAASTQRENQIPVVLLLNDEGKRVYDGGILAEIFAQVTTAAEPLQKLHSDWLQFAFRLGPYETSPELVKSMETVAKLASIPRFTVPNGPSISNLFYDKIKFNDYVDVQGFQADAFTCTQLKNIVFDFYYSDNPTNELSPGDLARELALAFSALIQVLPQPHNDTAFIGDSKHRREVMRDGFVVGCLSRLSERPNGIDWVQFLRQVGFDKANWNFSWTKSFSGKFYTQSLKIAQKIFREVFRNGQIPAGVPLLDQYFKGNGAFFEIESSVPTKGGRRPRQGPFKTTKFSAGIGQALTLAGDTYLRVSKFSNNIESIRVMDTAIARAVPPEFPKLMNRGISLNTKEHGRPMRLTFVLTLFGGTDAQTTLDVNW